MKSQAKAFLLLFMLFNFPTYAKDASKAVDFLFSLSRKPEETLEPVLSE